MNMAEQLEAIGDIISSSELCAEAMVNQISEILDNGDSNSTEE